MIIAVFDALTMYCVSVRRTVKPKDGHVQYVGVLKLDVLLPKNIE